MVVLPTCGDREINQDGEQCDDGNENNTDSCTNTCTANTPAPTGGGQASSVGGSISPAPARLLETGPQEEKDATQDTEGTPLSEAVDQVDSTTIPACTEEKYIISRLEKLNKKSNTIIYDVPAEYASLLGRKLIISSSQLLAKIRGENDATKRNNIIQSFVCKIEIIKEARGQKHKNI